MVCIHCGTETQVINSRSQKRLNQVWRRRQCLGCHAVFTTQEQAAYELAWAVRDKTGRLQPFSRDKLFLSLYESLRHRKTALADAGALTQTVVGRLRHQISKATVESSAITSVAHIALNRFDHAAGVQYNALHTYD